jgi:hypothetical protein
VREPSPEPVRGTGEVERDRWGLAGRTECSRVGGGGGGASIGLEEPLPTLISETEPESSSSLVPSTGPSVDSVSCGEALADPNCKWR